MIKNVTSSVAPCPSVQAIKSRWMKVDHFARAQVATLRTAATKRSRPYSSPSEFMASVTPSV